MGLNEAEWGGCVFRNNKQILCDFMKMKKFHISSSRIITATHTHHFVSLTLAADALMLVN